MAKINAAALCGPEVGDRVAAVLAGLDAADLAPVQVDGRLHPWEWIRLTDGGFCKADALDHACDHGLVGCQDIAWDVAGAAVEFRLTDGELDELRRGVAEGARRAPTVETVRLFELCYAAFQGGLWRLAEQVAEPAERGAIQRWRAKYGEVLRKAATSVPAISDPKPGRTESFQ